MSSLLKDRYNLAFYEMLLSTVMDIIPHFNKQSFLKSIFNKEFEQMELKARMKHTSQIFHTHLPNDFPLVARYWIQIAQQLLEKKKQSYGLELMFIPDYIETYGIDFLKESTEAFEKITELSSCEFAVRPFIIRYEKQMLKKLLKWSKHPNHHVRRLASEGSRPRLPWAIALNQFKKDPRPLLAILTQLKNDPSEYVRKSVSNHLNDISKDHPSILYQTIEAWKGKSKETDALLKHASRTLLKKGDATILKYFHYHDHPELICDEFEIENKRIKIGDSLRFSFRLSNNSKKSVIARIEYGIHYLRSNGSHGLKVFKISERELAAAEVLHVKRAQSFRVITTKTFYTGTQKLSIIINGKEKFLGSFDLYKS
ncbi:MAG: DNA alkylation repair protein [Bacteroidia bacterium]